MHSLIGKINRDPQFGKDPEFRNFYDNLNNNRCDSALSSESYASADSSSNDKTIVDLDLIVEKWIMYMWDKTKPSGKYSLDDMEIIVNWNKVDLIQEDAKFEGNNSSSNRKPHTQTLFKTYFTNKTNQEQEYSFKTERVTRQSCGFSFMKGFSREKEGGITFKIPQDIVEIGGGIRSEHSIECGKDQTKEEDITWAVDSMIRVKPNSRTCASLVINELELDRAFSIETRLKGRLFVQLNNRKENNQFVKSFSGDIVEIISQAIDRLWLPQGGSIFEIVDINGNRYARTVLKGRCKFRLGVEQFIELNEEDL